MLSSNLLSVPDTRKLSVPLEKLREIPRRKLLLDIKLPHRHTKACAVLKNIYKVSSFCVTIFSILIHTKHISKNPDHPLLENHASLCKWIILSEQIVNFSSNPTNFFHFARNNPYNFHSIYKKVYQIFENTSNTKFVIIKWHSFAQKASLYCQANKKNN